MILSLVFVFFLRGVLLLAKLVKWEIGKTSHHLLLVFSQFRRRSRNFEDYVRISLISYIVIKRGLFSNEGVFSFRFRIVVSGMSIS